MTIKGAILGAILALVSTTTAHAWKQTPDLPRDAPYLNQKEDNPCTGVKKQLKGIGFQLAFKKWIPLAQQSIDAAEIAKITSSFLQHSTIQPLHIRHYLNVSGKDSAFCSAVIIINGKPLVVTGEEQRNHIRYIVNKDGVFIVDYDVAIFDYSRWPEPTKPITN